MKEEGVRLTGGPIRYARVKRASYTPDFCANLAHRYSEWGIAQDEHWLIAIGDIPITGHSDEWVVYVIRATVVSKDELREKEQFIRWASQGWRLPITPIK